MSLSAVLLVMTGKVWAGDQPAAGRDFGYSSSVSSGSGFGSAGSEGAPQSSSMAEESCAQAAALMTQGVKLADGSAAEEDLYRRALEICPAMAEVHYNLGVVLFKRNNAEEALRSFERAVQLKDDPIFRSALGSVKLSLGRVEEARQEFESLLKAQPQNVKALQGLSLALEKSGQWAEALEMLRRARALEANDFITQFNLGVMYERVGQLDSAIESYQKATQIDAGHYDAWYYLGLAYEKAGRYLEGQAAMRRAVELKRGSLEAENALARLYGRSEDWEKAELALRRAVAMNDRDAATLINLAIVLLKKKQPALAGEMAVKALNLEPKNVRALGVTGWAELELGNYAQAEKHFLAALELDAGYAAVHQALGVLYQRQGRKEEAQVHYDAAFKLDPSLEAQKKIDWRFW